MSSDPHPLAEPLRAILNSGRYALPLSTHGQALEIIATLNNAASWNDLAARGIPTDLFKAQAKSLRAFIDQHRLNLPIASHTSELLAKTLANTVPAVKGPRPQPGKSQRPEATPFDVFADPNFRDASFDTAPREFYMMGRQVFPAGMEIRGDVLEAHAEFISTVDWASKVIVSLERCSSDFARASELQRAVLKAIDQFGRPTKGWVLSYSLWWSVDDLLASDNDELVARGRELKSEGAIFQRMPIEERMAFENWLTTAGMECSFTEEWCYGRPKVSAEMAREEFPSPQGVHVERVPGSKEWEGIWRPRFPLLWAWCAGAPIQAPAGYRNPDTAIGEGFASLLRADDASSVESQKYRYRFLLQHHLSMFGIPTVLVSAAAVARLASQLVPPGIKLSTEWFPKPAIRFIFERGSLATQGHSLECLEYAVGRKGERLAIPESLLGDQSAAEHFRRPLNLPQDLMVTCAAFRLKESQYSWDLREIVTEYPLTYFRSAEHFASTEDLGQKTQGHVNPKFPEPASTPLPETRRLLINLIRQLRDDPSTIASPSHGSQPAIIRC